MNPLLKPTAETSQTMQDFPPPLWLKHQPIYMVPYAPFDGPYARDTDAKYLSIGLAQWRNANDPNVLSAKVWRNPGDKWSRQSEELPLHRVIDLCTLLAKALYQGQAATGTFNPLLPIEAGTFEGQSEKLEVRCMGVPGAAGFTPTNDLVKSRLRRLRDELVAAKLG